MVVSKVDVDKLEDKVELTRSQRRRLRRQKLKTIKNPPENIIRTDNNNTVPSFDADLNLNIALRQDQVVNNTNRNTAESNMSSKEDTKSRDDVLAAREAKKLAKQKAKNKDGGDMAKAPPQKDTPKEKENIPKADKPKVQSNAPKCKDEVDRAVAKEPTLEVNKAASTEKSKEQVLSERAAKKAAKQAKKKGTEDIVPNPDLTVKDVVQTLKDIKEVAKDIQDITAKVSAIDLQAKKQPSEADLNKPKSIDEKDKCKDEGKSKGELRAERRAKQEAQRAAKQAAEQKAKPKEVAKPEPSKEPVKVVKEKSPKLKSEKSKLKLSGNRVNWFQHLYAKDDKEALKKITVNSNLHPAITKLGAQLASRVVCGSNARCIALLDALKKMLKDYTLPAKTEFARGLEAHLAASLDFLWSMRQPSASQTNAVKYFRHHLTQLPNNVDEFDAKKILQEEVDKYIEDQIDKAGEAISMTVQKKICTGDNILTYGSSSLIERCLREAWQSGLVFGAVVVGAGEQGGGGARHMLRRLTATGLPCSYADITAVSYLMKNIDKVLLGASALLVNGSVLGSAGTVTVALAARAHNVPVLVAAETHKFSERVQTDAFVYNELGDPNELVDPNDDSSPLKDWRSNPNLTVLNLTYDVTPASLVTAVVTEKAILPCTSAPVVLRTKLTEYGM